MKKGRFMKKIIALFLMSLILGSNAYAAVLPAGTVVNVQPTQEIDADDVKAGDLVNFTVTYPVKYNEKVIIKSGTEVTAQVVKRKNNFILGIPGAIEIGNFKIYQSNNNVINLRGTAIDKGENKYWANIGWFFLFPLLFFKGDDGKIPMSNQYMLYTTEDINL